METMNNDTIIALQYIVFTCMNYFEIFNFWH